MSRPRNITDPYLHATNLQYQKSRCQARHRGEPWQITLEEFRAMWTPQRFKRRGKAGTDLCMSRIDDEAAWCVNNMIIVERRLHLRIKNFKKHGLNYEYLYKHAEWAAQ